MDGKKEIPPFITLARKLFNDPMWTKERFSYAQAWVDLLYWAFHSDGNFKWEDERYDLKRGQLCHTESFLMKRWQWGRGRLRRTLKKWEKSDQIAIHRVIHTTIHGAVQSRKVISICNYNQYQMPNTRGDTYPDTYPDTRGETSAVHNKKELKERIIKKNYKSARARVSSEKDKKNSLKLLKQLTSQYERDKEKGLA